MKRRKKKCPLRKICHDLINPSCHQYLYPSPPSSPPLFHPHASESDLNSYDDFCNRPYVRNCCRQLRNNDLIRTLIQSTVPTRFHTVSYSSCVGVLQNGSPRSQLLR